MGGGGVRTPPLDPRMTNSQKHKRRKKYWFLLYIYQLSLANCVEYQWKLKFTDPSTMRKSGKNKYNLNKFTQKSSMGIVLLFEIWSEKISKSNQRFINSDVNILILHDHTTLYRCLCKNDECAGNSNYAHLCACFFFFMTQCGLLGPMQKYVNMPHRLDKCFLFIWYLVCFFLILPIRKNFALC